MKTRQTYEKADFIGRIIGSVDSFLNFKSFKTRIIFTLSFNLLGLLIVVLFFINDQGKKQISEQAHENAAKIAGTTSMSIEKLMLTGSNELVEELRNNLLEKNIIDKLEIYPSEVSIEDYEHLERKVSRDKKN